ncbi:MAG: barstar family protein [Clostridia bacterium]|nr:barstar family protein [Clostridia bacterium]
MYQYKDLYTIDFSKVEYYIQMHKIIQEALEFPDYYGCNWDAFWDCLIDMVGRPIHIEIIGFKVVEQKFGEEAKIMMDILKEFKHYRNDKYAKTIKIEIVMGERRFEL